MSFLTRDLSTFRAEVDGRRHGEAAVRAEAAQDPEPAVHAENDIPNDNNEERR